MKTSVTIKTKDNKHYNIGDPFILRFNGVYYLYPSAECDEAGIRCFTSKDLQVFEEYGYVAEDVRLLNAYAPEVIYHDGYFLMCTSPGGNGHYFLKSSSPLGPFEILSGNLKQMIDGTFIHDEEFNLYFARADHNGIALLRYEDNKFKAHHNMLPQISKAWTEGPTIFYEDDYYRATYCGNYVWSRNYRIKSASSKNLTNGYKVDDNPLLLSTENGFHSLGHNSVTRSPDLTKRVIAYHGRIKDDFSRYLFLDTLQFNGKRTTVLFNDSYSSPNFEHRYDFKPLEEDVDLISGFKDMIIEITFRGNISIRLESENYQFKNILKFCDGRLQEELITSHSDKTTIKSHDLHVDTDQIHTILLNKRTVVGGHEANMEIRIDEVPVIPFIPLVEPLSFILEKGSIVDYVAASFIENNSSFSIPNIIEATSLAKKRKDSFNLKRSSERDENYSQYIANNPSKEDYSAKESKTAIKVHGDKGLYQLYATCTTSSVCKLSISTNQEKKEVSIQPCDSDYSERFLHLCDIQFDEDDELFIEVLEGEFSFYRIEISKPISVPITLEENYSFYPRKENDEIHFTIHHFEEDSLFGMLVEAKGYCSHSSVHHPKCCGYLIGMRNDLLVVEHLQYETERIYDVPVSIREGEEHTLSYTKKDDHLIVYFDSKEMISIYLPFEEKEGCNGRYISSHSDVTIK